MTTISTPPALRIASTIALLVATAVLPACSGTPASAQRAATDPATSHREEQPETTRDSAVAPPPGTVVALVRDTFAARQAAPPAPAVNGTLEASRRAVLRAELAGPVRTLALRVGERVAAGAVVAVLDVPAVLHAKASAAAHEAAAVATQRQAMRERERVAQLLVVGGASRAELEEFDARVNAANATLAAARATVALAEADVARRTIRAPFGGVVERRPVTPGSMVQPGDELMTIVDPRELELEGAVAMAHVSAVRVGAAVRMRVSGFDGDTLAGRVTRIAPALDPVTRQLRISVALPNADGRIPVGAWAEGVVTPRRDATRGR